MATRTLGTNANNSLVAVRYQQSLSDADIATIDQGIANDFSLIGPYPGTGNTALQGGVIMSGTFSIGSKDITSVTVSSPTGAPLGSVAGLWLYGQNAGIPSGSRVQPGGVSGTTVSMTAAATVNGAATFFAIGDNLSGSFNRMGQLYIPNRGYLQLFPDDVIAVGNGGEVILVPKNAINYSGSDWTLT